MKSTFPRSHYDNTSRRRQQSIFIIFCTTLCKKMWKILQHFLFIAFLSLLLKVKSNCTAENNMHKFYDFEFSWLQCFMICEIHYLMRDTKTNFFYLSILNFWGFLVFSIFEKWLRVKMWSECLMIYEAKKDKHDDAPIFLFSLPRDSCVHFNFLLSR